MIKGVKIPTILGILLLLAGVAAGVFLLNSANVFRIGADPTASPKDIRVSNVGDNSVTISWTTDKETTDFLVWGETSKDLNNVEKETEGNQKFANHIITLTGLLPDTNYFYKINSQGSDFDNQGIPWEVRTGKLLDTQQGSNVISGTVLDSAGQPAERALIYLDINGYLMSTLTSSTGNFIFQLGGARTQDLSALSEIINSETILDISVVGSGGEVSTVKILPQSAHPIPPIILGQTYDHRNLPPSVSGDTPNADLNLPPDATPESKLNLPPAGSSKPQAVSLESVDNGETVSSEKPQFFGNGPSGETITIEIHSDSTVTKTLTIPSSGSWNFTPPTNLSPGTHTITITWTDAAGILRKITKTFIVQASEAPAFTASQSGLVATPSPTPIPTKSPTPIPTASATLTASPSARPTATPTLAATPSPTPSPTVAPTLRPTGTPKPPALPDSGDLTPTILLSIMGLGIMMFGFFVWKLSNE